MFFLNEKIENLWSGFFLCQSKIFQRFQKSYLENRASKSKMRKMKTFFPSNVSDLITRLAKPLYSTLPKKWQFEQMAKSTGNALQRFREQMAIRTNGNSSSPGFKENWKWQDGVGGLEVLHEVAVAGFRNGGFGECSFQRSNVHSAPT